MTAFAIELCRSVAGKSPRRKSHEERLLTLKRMQGFVDDLPCSP